MIHESAIPVYRGSVFSQDCHMNFVT